MADPDLQIRGGGGDHPDPEIRGGPHFARKIRGEPGFPGPSPGSTTGTCWKLAQVPTVAFFL